MSVQMSFKWFKITDFQYFEFLCFKEPLWKTQDISEEVFLAGLCLAEKFYFLVLAEIRFTAAAWFEKHAHGFCVLTLMHLFSGSVNQHATISEAKPLKLVGACSKW